VPDLWLCFFLCFGSFAAETLRCSVAIFVSASGERHSSSDLGATGVSWSRPYFGLKRISQFARFRQQVSVCSCAQPIFSCLVRLLLQMFNLVLFLRYRIKKLKVFFVLIALKWLPLKHIHKVFGEISVRI
jgi:hypothetical protein